MFTGILQRFLILETFIVAALCCFCSILDSTKDHFCVSEFVVKAKAEEEVKGLKEPTFAINIIQFFKGNPWKLNLVNNSEGLLTLALPCPYQIKSGETYLIMGEFYHSTIRSPQCSGNKRWDHLLYYELDGLEGDYAYRCSNRAYVYEY